MRKGIIGALLSGAAIIALSGCTSEPVAEDGVDIEELNQGYEVVFQFVPGTKTADTEQDPLAVGKNSIYMFCPFSDEATAPQSDIEPNGSTTSGIYSAGSEEGSFAIDDVNVLLYKTEESDKSAQATVDPDYSIETEDGSLKVEDICRIHGSDYKVLEINFNPEACDPADG